MLCGGIDRRKAVAADRDQQENGSCELEIAIAPKHFAPAVALFFASAAPVSRPVLVAAACETPDRDNRAAAHNMSARTH
jgi:hypothetical protein